MVRSALTFAFASLLLLGAQTRAVAVGLWAAWLAFLFVSLQERRRYQRLRRQLRSVLDAAGVTLHDYDLDDPARSTNLGPIEDLVGWTSSEWARMDHRQIIHPDDMPMFWKEADDLVDGEVFDRVARFRRRDGSYAVLRDVSRYTGRRRGHRRIAGLTLDITATTAALEQARHAAEVDQLTGLPNRSSLTQALERRLRQPGDFAFFLLDLDGFKTINDTLGHASGDRVLVEVADRLRSLAGAAHCVGRLGGDEFAVIVDESELRGTARSWGEEIAARIGRPISLGELAVTSQVSVGIVRTAEHPGDAAEVLGYQRVTWRFGDC